jgi:hypothetical protein
MIRYTNRTILLFFLIVFMLLVAIRLSLSYTPKEHFGTTTMETDILAAMNAQQNASKTNININSNSNVRIAGSNEFDNCNNIIDCKTSKSSFNNRDMRQDNTNRLNNQNNLDNEQDNTDSSKILSALQNNNNNNQLQCNCPPQLTPEDLDFDPYTAEDKMLQNLRDEKIGELNGIMNQINEASSVLLETNVDGLVQSQNMQANLASLQNAVNSSQCATDAPSAMTQSLQSTMQPFIDRMDQYNNKLQNLEKRVRRIKFAFR